MKSKYKQYERLNEKKRLAEREMGILEFHCEFVPSSQKVFYTVVSPDSSSLLCA
jgi:hypothetical protein